MIVVEPGVDVGEHLRLLRLGQPLVLDRLVELLRQLALQRGLQPGDGLVLRLRDVGQRLAVAELLVQLLLVSPR